MTGQKTERNLDNQLGLAWSQQGTLPWDRGDPLPCDIQGAHKIY